MLSDATYTNEELQQVREWIADRGAEFIVRNGLEMAATIEAQQAEIEWLQARASRLEGCGKAVDRFLLVIESAVRQSDPANRDAVLDAMTSLTAALHDTPETQ